jgi:segregation and condensation protein A
MSIILRQLKVNNMLEFSQLFDVAQEGVPKLVVCFLAILELAREGLLRLTQQAPFSPIYVQLNSRE